jgi:hypothetical protein
MLGQIKDAIRARLAQPIDHPQPHDFGEHHGLIRGVRDQKVRTGSNMADRAPLLDWWRERRRSKR